MVSWVDNLLVLGEVIDVNQIKSDLQAAIVCKCKGTMKEHVGNKIIFCQKSEGFGIVKFIQPVLIQKLEDEFELPKGKPPFMPAVAGQLLI